MSLPRRASRALWEQKAQKTFWLPTRKAKQGIFGLGGRGGIFGFGGGGPRPPAGAAEAEAAGAAVAAADGAAEGLFIMIARMMIRMMAMS